MPNLLYNLQLTEDEILHLWTLLAMRTLQLSPIGIEEVSIIEKVEELMQVTKQ